MNVEACHLGGNRTPMVTLEGRELVGDETYRLAFSADDGPGLAEAILRESRIAKENQ